MYVFFNPHPKNEYRDDCVKRAIVKATNMSYQEVSNGLREHRKVTGVRCFNDNPNPESYATKVLGMKHIILEESNRMSTRDFCKKYNKGTYIISTNGHWVTAIDGVIYDTFNTLDRVVWSYYSF